jgi:hypothetical protein
MEPENNFIGNKRRNNLTKTKKTNKNKKINETKKLKKTVKIDQDENDALKNKITQINQKYSILNKIDYYNNIKDINYEIETWSSYISNFHPRNVLIDSKIGGPLSKWSVDFKSQTEFLLLKLEKTSIVHMIPFGKFKDPTNLKEFKILAGPDKSNMVEILHSGLSYDNEYEPFPVTCKWKNSFIPCK